MSDLEYVVEHGIGTITLNRPARRNAFTLEMVEQWAEILVHARTDDAVRVVVLTGAGTAFCSGVDLEQNYGQPPTPLRRKLNMQERVHRIPLALQDLDKPVIAAINGAAIGAGLDMALMCDMRIMARSAKLAEGYIKVGMMPADGGCYYLPRLVGIAKALELLLTGDSIDADEALRLGVVNRVVDDEHLPAAVAELAGKIAAASPLAVRAIKRATYQSADSDLRTALDLISSHLAVFASTSDATEAISAFREKRTPTFTGS